MIDDELRVDREKEKSFERERERGERAREKLGFTVSCKRQSKIAMAKKEFTKSSES